MRHFSEGKLKPFCFSHCTGSVGIAVSICTVTQYLASINGPDLFNGQDFAGVELILAGIFYAIYLNLVTSTTASYFYREVHVMSP